MDRQTENKIVLIKRKTRLEELILRYNTLEQARFYIEHLGSDFSDYIAEDKRYKHSVALAVESLEALGRLQVLDRQFVPNFIFGPKDTVVAVGQDGLVANTLKYLNGQPLIGVNPDPARWDGVLLPFAAEELTPVVQELFRGKRPLKEVTMAKVSLNDGQVLYGVNDLFIGARTHVSARYGLRLGEKAENQSSSGIIVSTGLGSTGWLKSVVIGAGNIFGSLRGKSFPLQNYQELPWNTDHLIFSVREPFPSKTSGATLVFGQVGTGMPLKIVSHMPDYGVIFSDGMEQDFLQFNAGVEATVTLAEKRGQLVW